MNGPRTQNALLFVIALCLVLIVLKLYGDDLVTSAEAAPASMSNKVLIYGCTASGGEDCTGSWRPILVDGAGAIVQRR